MTAEELRYLKNQITLLEVFNWIFLILNILLVVFPIIHYWTKGFTLDWYFLIVTLLNAAAFYFSYEINNKLAYFKKKHNHFSNKLLNNT
jgi:hypothetical protein